MPKSIIEAHNFARKAENTFKLVGDFCRQGYALDTQAIIYLAEKDYGKALECAEKGIRLLQNGENKLFLLNTYKTKIRALLGIQNTEGVYESYVEAKHIAEQIDQLTLTNFIKDIEPLLTSENLQSLEQS